MLLLLCVYVLFVVQKEMNHLPITNITNSTAPPAHVLCSVSRMLCVPSSL